MDSLVGSYINKLHENIDNESNAMSVLVLLYEVLNVEHEKKELNLETLFNEETGIIPYLKILSRKSQIQGDLIKELLNLLKTVIVDFTNAAEKYFPSLVKKFCENAIMHSASRDLKIMAYDVMLLLIKTPDINFFQANMDWLNLFYQKLLHDKIDKHISSTEKKKVYELLGEIIFYSPELMDTQRQNQIFRLLLSHTRKQIQYEKQASSSFKVAEMEGLYECLCLFLQRFHNEDYVKGSKEELFNFVKQGCDMVKHRRTSVRAALKILENHFDLFAEDVFKDYKWWTELLTRYLSSSNKDDQLASFHVLNSYYRGIAKILKQKSSENETLKYFIGTLQTNMKRNSNYEVALAVENFGHFAKVCRVYDEKLELERMFGLTSQIAENYCSGQVDDNIELRHMASLLVSMAKINKNLYNTSSYEDDFTILGKFSTFVFISYPKVPSNFRHHVKNNLIKTVITVASINDTFLASYLEKLVFVSLIKCCSCPLKRDVEYMNNLGNTENGMISCNDYVPLWKSLCNIENELTEHRIVSEKTKLDAIHNKNLPSRVFDIFIKAIFNILEKLDFSVLESDYNSDGIGIIDDCGFKPRTESDFYIFINLVELFSAVIDGCEICVFEKWIPELIKTFIDLSCLCSIKSGFFELLTVIFEKGGSEVYYQQNLHQLKSFLIETLVNIRKLKGIDLITCLRMILKIPYNAVETISPYMTPVLQVVFTQGLEDLSLAKSGLVALKNWSTCLGPEIFRPILQTVIPLLNPYLQSKKSIGDTETLTKYEERLLMPVITRPKNKIYKKYHNMYSSSTSVELLKFQKEIVKFLGEIEVDLCRTVYNPEKQNASEFTEVLRFEVPFADMKVKIFLDKFLTRIIELTNDNDIKTRTAACEMLHSMMVVFLGNSNKFEEELPKPTENLFKQLVSCIIRLGSDNNLVIKLIFTQLSQQLARYYSSRHKYQSNVTSLLLEILFDSVSHSHDISLRHFSASLIKEFVNGSLKERTSAGSSTHILAVIKRICLFSVQPCAFRRQGAALAFNSIYKEIREKINLVNMYWIELLVHFVRSSSLNSEDNYNDDEISRALQHIKRVLVEKLDIFIESNDSRRVPKCLVDGKITTVISWILPFCVNENKLCRNKCMEFIVDLSSRLPGCESLRIYFNSHESEKKLLLDKVYTSISVDREFLKCGDISYSNRDEYYHIEFAKRTIGWLKSLLSGTHCVHWMLQQGFPVDSSLNTDERFLNSMKFYCETILPNTLHDCIQENFAHIGDGYIPANLKAKYEVLKYEVFCQYLTILEVSDASLEVFVGDELWQDYFWQMAINYLYAPSTFTMNSAIHECASAAILMVLSKLKEIPANKQELIFNKIRQSPTHRMFEVFLDNIESCHIVSLNEKHYVNALLELHKSAVIDCIFPDMKKRKREIINKMFEYVRSHTRAKTCNPAITIQLEPLLAFALIDCETNFVLELLANSRALILSNSVSDIAHGRHFFNIFKKPIVQFLSHHQKNLIDNYLLPHVLTKEKLQIVINCLKFVAEPSRILKFDILIEGIFNNWSSLTCWSSSSECSQYLFSLIDAMLVRDVELKYLSSEVKSPVFLWLINKLLNEESVLTRRKEYFKLLTPFITNASEQNDAVLRNKLEEFRSKYFEVSSSYRLRDAEYVNTYNALLSLFANCENEVVLEMVISIGASDEGEDCDVSIQQTLETVMRRVSTEDQLKLLNVMFAMFKNPRKVATFRLNCVQKFLVPSLYTCNLETLKTLFASEMDFIFEMLKAPISGCSENETILLKTAAVSIAEVYSDLECEEIKHAVSVKGSSVSRTVKSLISKVILDIVITQVTLQTKSNEPALRKLKCYCYNTLIKMVQKTPKDVKFYAHLFKEDCKRLIWESIIDSEEEINLKMYIDELPARKKALKQKRRELKTKCVNRSSMRSIPTQYLSTSSLISNIKYDMSEWNISNEGYVMQNENKSYNIDLEEDKLNNHECMATICELIVFIVESNISPLPDLDVNPNPEPPLWMENLRHSLKVALRKKQKNIVLYFLKIIHNCKTVFCPYAKSWIDLIIDCILMLNDVNYLTVDVTVMMLTWCKVYIPIDREKNNQLLSLILKKISYDQTTVRNYQLELIRTFIKYWYEHLDIPHDHMIEVFSQEVSSIALEKNLTVAKVFLLQGVLPFDQRDAEARTFSLVLFQHIDRSNLSRGIKILCFEVIALILEVVKSKKILFASCEQIYENLFQKLNSLKVDNLKTKTDLFFSCLEHTLICFPDILNRFVPYLLYNFIKFQGKIKAQCLKMIAIDIGQLPEDAFTQLMSMQFENCFRESNHEILKNALIVLKKFIKTVKEEELLTLLPDIIRLSSHAVSECRQLVYEIADSVYSEYRNKNEESCKRIKSQCKVILLNGLLDSDRSLQESIFASWKESCKLSNKIKDRFLVIVKDMYSPHNESRFVNYATDFLLDACSSTPDFKSKIFDNPLGACEFKEQDFTPLTAFKNRHSLAPMFMNSLSNQLVELSLFSSKMCTLVMPGSQRKLHFQPTQHAGSSMNSSISSNTSQWNMLKDFSKNDVEVRKLQNRLQASTAKVSEYFAIRNIEKREKRFEILKARSDRTEKNIQFSRTYRDGEFPDIEIPRSAVVSPMKVLSKRDPIMARLIFIGIFDGMLAEITDKKGYIQAVSNSFNEILKLTLQHDSILIETIFETMFFHSSDIQLDSQRIVISSHASGLLSLGSLILENSLQAEMMMENTSHSSKRLKIDDSAYQNKWLQLAELYKALDKNDIVSGILKEKIQGHASDDMKKGLEFEQVADWQSACDVYKKKIEESLKQSANSFEEHFIFDAYLKCAANLSKWTDMKDMICKKFQNLDELWHENWDIEHTLPWYFTAEAIICVQEDRLSDELDIIKTWMKDEERSLILMNLIAESISVLLFLHGENHEAKYKISKSVESMLQNWNHSTTSLDKFYKLLTLSEIDSMLTPFEVSCGTLSIDAVQGILKMWSSSAPCENNLYWWDKRITYRQRFSSKYIEQLDEADREGELCIESLKSYNIWSSLEMVQVAFQQKSEALADKYLVEAQFYEDETSEVRDIKSQLILNQSKVLLLMAEKSKSTSKYIHSLNILDEYTSNTNFTYTYHMHLANTLCVLQNKWSSFAREDRLEIIGILKKLLRKPNIDADTVLIEMQEAVINHYKNAGKFAQDNKNHSAAETSASYLSLAKYCKELFNSDINDANSTYEENFVRSILRSMKFDSKEAQLLFPTLLQLKQITSDDLKNVFTTESALIEEWKFLIWMQQLLAHIDTEVLSVIEKLLLSIISKYPNAIQFSFLSSDLTRFSYNNPAAQRISERLRQILNRNTAISAFVKAISYVRVPEGYFKYYLKKLSKLLRRSNIDEINTIKNELVSDNSLYRGKLFTESKWWQRLTQLLTELEDGSRTKSSILSQIDSYLAELSVLRTKREYHPENFENTKLLRNYSCWFDNFNDMGITNIEIPGQYSGFSPPNPDRHVKIFEFNKIVQVQESLQSPIKIQFIGDDAKEYSYLVKFGEDTRQDQRIQQIFSIMNQCSVSEASGSDDVSVINYGVFPLTTYFGIIEWLEQTISLRNFMDYQLPESKKKESNLFKSKLRDEYSHEIANYSTNRRDIYCGYEKAVKIFSKDRIITTFKNVQNKISQDVFKKSILALCNSPIMYWNLRNQFMISYSTLCMYGWILGIGDRHLSNIIVCLKTGRCIGIDFGHAFGTGTTYQELPELIPFRMTPHIVSVMAPFYLTGLIRETMVNVLKIIHKNEYILFATMQIFILDPSFNWLKSIRKRRQELIGVEETNDLQWYPNHKMERIRQKLRGVNPLKILEDEVRENIIISTSYRDACVKLLNREDCIRALLPVDSEVSLIEQVDCLLDIATDECILGTSWVGLETYI